MSQVIEIHTSDRQLYKRCRRKFGWGSTLRDNLIIIGPEKSNFFLGTGFHFALEDYWGYRRFEHPALAYAAYHDAHKPEELPDDADELLDLAASMLDYYVTDWLIEHPEPFKTLWIDGKPQVEVEVAVDITDIILEEADRRDPSGEYRSIVGEWTDNSPLHYVTTYDRVVIDPQETIYGLDYKTAASFDELNLQTNPQAGSYDWSLNLFYGPHGYRVGGIYWQQHIKDFPSPPKRVNVGKSNESFSLATTQKTTYRLYRKAVFEHYGHLPKKYEEIIGILIDRQDEYGDQFIRREVLRRNQTQREVEQGKIVAEVLEMLDPDLPLYPNPIKDCSWDCAFKEPCLAIDDGSDYQFILDHDFSQWSGYKDDWRKRVKYPSASSETTNPQLVTV